MTIARALLALFAGSLAVFCAFVAFALAADNGALVFARLPGALALLAFAGTATAAAIVALRCLRPLTRHS